VSSSIVLIGPAHALPALCERLDAGAELHTFTDAEALEALDHVMRIRPQIVALEKGFSTTSRGRALINRITADPSLHDCEIRVVAPDSSTTRMAPATPPAVFAAAAGGGEAAAPAAATAVIAPLDQRGTRRAPRVAVREGVEVFIDGSPATLIDISVVGVQVISQKLLKPNQRVRVSLPQGASAIRCDGAIAWAAFEMPKGQSPRCRAGIELTGADPAALGAYAEKHRKN
jgi:hypothetical protein